MIPLRKVLCFQVRSKAMSNFFTGSIFPKTYTVLSESIVHDVEAFVSETSINFRYRLISFVKKALGCDSERQIFHEWPSISYNQPGQKCVSSRCQDCCSPFTATQLLCLFLVVTITMFSQSLPVGSPIRRIRFTMNRTFL